MSFRVCVSSAYSKQFQAHTFYKWLARLGARRAQASVCAPSLQQQQQLVCCGGQKIRRIDVLIEKRVGFLHRCTSEWWWWEYWRWRQHRLAFARPKAAKEIQTAKSLHLCWALSLELRAVLCFALSLYLCVLDCNSCSSWDRLTPNRRRLTQLCEQQQTTTVLVVCATS